MIKIEYESTERLPYEIEVEEKDALNKMIEITSDGGHIYWVERVSN